MIRAVTDAVTISARAAGERGPDDESSASFMALTHGTAALAQDGDLKTPKR
jgi:hypothetical protein